MANHVQCHVDSVTGTTVQRPRSRLSRLGARSYEHIIVINDDSPQDGYWIHPSQRMSIRHRGLLRKPSSSASFCIYEVPPTMQMMDRKYFDPQVVSIGPFHYGCEAYQMLEEHKARYFRLLVTRSGLQVNDYFEAVRGRLDEIKSCYSKRINCEMQDLVAIVVIDGCFIIEMFRMVKGLVPEGKNDPILNMAQLFPFLLRDFMLLENQIPFFVLQLLFDKSKTSIDGDYTLTNLAISFFKYALPKPLRFRKFKKDYDSSKVKHLLDLLRLSMIESVPMEQELRPVADWKDAYLPRIPSAIKLRLGGINIKRRADNLINIGFDDKKGWLKIPALILDDFVSTFLSNCVAFENCDADNTMHFSTYVTFMGCLVNKETDAEFLTNQRVLENYLGKDADAADFFSDLAGGCVVDIRRSYLADVFYGVNNYYENKWNQTWAELWNTYFSSPWSFLSALAVLVGLLLTGIQAYFAIFSKK